MAQTAASTDRAERLDVFDAPESDVNQIYTFETDEVTAHCPFDFGGPDFYSFTLRYVPDDLCIESKSLKKYIESFRTTEITAEELGTEMYEAFDAIMNPEKMYIRLEQARRGGIEETVEFGDRTLRTEE
jgi:7-cyano-7-deazaguanine reductase